MSTFITFKVNDETEKIRKSDIRSFTFPDKGSKGKLYTYTGITYTLNKDVLYEIEKDVEDEDNSNSKDKSN